MLYLALGCFRSGTSAVGCIFKENNYYCGPTVGKVPYQPVELVEIQGLIDAQEAILNNNDSAWYCPSEIRKFTMVEYSYLNFVFETLLNDHGNYIEELCDSEELDFFIKSHRSLFMLEPMLNLPALKSQEIKMFGIFRNPISVARSFSKLDAPDKKLTFEEGLELWYAYNSMLLEAVKKYDFPVINFDNYTLYEDIEKIVGVSLCNKNSFRPELDVDADDTNYKDMHPDTDKYSALWHGLKRIAIGV